MIKWKPLITVALPAIFMLMAAGCAEQPGGDGGMVSLPTPGNPHQWKMASAFGSRLRLIGESGVRLTEKVKRKSDGALQLKFYEPF